MRLKKQRLLEIDVRGVEHVRQSLNDGCGVLIAPNHPSHADPFTYYDAMDCVPSAAYFMATWHVFDSRGAIGQWALQHIGVFSVDREGADLQAFKESIRILRECAHPLIIFPEGEIYHCNDRVTPFREGPAAIALSAARRSERPIVCIPSAVKYEYLDDPTPGLKEMMEELEAQIHWRPKRALSLPERIYAFAEAMLALKELEYLGAVSHEPLPDRVRAMTESILKGLEERHEYDRNDDSIPERIKEVRRRVLDKFQPEAESDENSTNGEGSVDEEQLIVDLEDLFFVSQLYSYPGDYITQEPTIERLAETFDKFEEDVLHRPSATIRGTRKATVYFDEPIRIEGKRRSKTAASDLTNQIESRVQWMLDHHAEITRKLRRANG
jgi:1-acyl-sn-glycerol-3-phosphate acyltransferase